MESLLVYLLLQGKQTGRQALGTRKQCEKSAERFLVQIYLPLLPRKTPNQFAAEKELVGKKIK
ncbi:hypothetical protein MKX01_035032, partial [Papaver californicum]